jgi:hypothetical protein
MTESDQMTILMDHVTAEPRPIFLFGSLIPPHGAIEADYARRWLSVSDEAILGEVLKLSNWVATWWALVPELLGSLHSEIEGTGLRGPRKDETCEYEKDVTHTHMMTPMEILA